MADGPFAHHDGGPMAYPVAPGSTGRRKPGDNALGWALDDEDEQQPPKQPAAPPAGRIEWGS